VDREALESDPRIQNDGGYNRLNKVFGGQLEAVLADINEELWKGAA
jgi:type I restriction enzyme, R subunit